MDGRLEQGEMGAKEMVWEVGGGTRPEEAHTKHNHHKPEISRRQNIRT